MTVFRQLVRGQKHHGTAKVLSTFLFLRHKGDALHEALAAVTQPTPVSTKKQTSNRQSLNTAPRDNYLPFFDMLNKKQKEAERSILVEIEGPKYSGSLKRFCEQIGPVNKCFLYRASGKNFVLVEFQKSASKSYAVTHAFHSKNPQSIPVTTPFLYYHHPSERAAGIPLPDSTQDIQCNEENVLEELPSLQCISDNRLKAEIEYLQRKSQISDLSFRLRFFTCHQLDIALEGLFSGVRALPFGSSVSGFGSNTGDLDIYLNFKRNLNTQDKPRLFFQTKEWIRDDKNAQLKFTADLIRIMLPGCSEVCSLLHARVPIIKYRQSISDLECDLNNSHAGGVDLTHILWLMNHWDPRVAPLIFTLRMWAKTNKITSKPRPTPLITNFSIMIMAVFFLQIQNILPALDSLRKLPENIVTPSLDPDCTLLFPKVNRLPRDKLPSVTASNVDVDTLLYNFFEFYSNFNFEKHQISIFHGKVLPKSSSRPLELMNPAATSLNIARNVTLAGLQVFIRCVKESYAALGKDYQSQSLISILPLVSSKRRAELRPNWSNMKKYS